MIYKSYLVEQNVELIRENQVLFYGENLGLKDEFKKKIKNINKDVEIINYTQEEILKNEEKFFSEISNISLFSKKKIYLINQSNDKILDLVNEAGPKIDETKLYLFSDILDKKSKLRNYFEKSKNCGIIPCYADNEISIKKIVLNNLRGFDGLTPQNINLIVENSNLDRVKLNNELNKIYTFFKNKKINYDSLEKLLDLKVNDDFNTLKDGALSGDKILTNKLLSETIIDTEKNIFYLTLINQRLNKLLDISRLSKDVTLEEAIGKIKPPIFWKDKPNLIKQVRKWNYKKIQNALSKTYKLEVEMKSNPIINKNVLMKKLIVEICEMATL